jgi:hypothetical protein
MIFILSTYTELTVTDTPINHKICEGTITRLAAMSIIFYINKCRMETNCMQLNIHTAVWKFFSCSDKIFSSRDEFPILKGVA